MTATAHDFSKWIPYAGTPELWRAGQVVFDESTAGDCTFIVARGRVEIRHQGQVLEVVGPGGMIGEMALIDDSPRSASAVAAEDAELVPLERARFLFLVQETPTFALEVMRLFADRLRKVNDRIR